MKNQNNIQALLEKVEAVTKEKKLDLSSDEDLSVAIMNLISIEEHLFFTSQKTGKPQYLELLNQVREMRKELLKKIVKDYEGEVWCLLPNTVLLANPEPKAISEFKSGDKVLTHKGKFEKVKRVFVRDYNGDLTSISPYYADPLILTPGHEVLCATGVRKKQKDLWRKNFSPPKVVWKKAEDVNPSDFLLFPRYLDSEDINEIELTYSWLNKGCFKPTVFHQNKKIKVDRRLLKLIGLYLSEGSISEGKSIYKNTTKTRAVVYFSFGKYEVELIKKTQSLFEEVFKTPLKVSETKTTIDLICSHRIIVKFFKEFGGRSKEKEVPFWVLRLPKNKLYSLIWGLVMGDGMIDKYQISYFTSSEKLAYQLRILLFKIGIIHSLKKIETGGGKIEGRTIKPSQGFEISISGDAARLLDKNSSLKYKVRRTSGNFGYVLDDYVMLPVRKVDKVNYSGQVYNLQTEAHTYTTFTGVVHNCISKHLLAASMRLMEVGTKELGKGNKKEAWKLFEKAYSLYSLFWGINLKVVKLDNVKPDINSVNYISETGRKQASVSVFAKLGVLVQKAINCCRE